MVSRKIVTKNVSGLHLRPTGLLCDEAINCESSIKFHFGNATSNTKSVLSVLGACIKCGDEVGSYSRFGRRSSGRDHWSDRKRSWGVKDHRDGARKI